MKKAEGSKSTHRILTAYCFLLSAYRFSLCLRCLRWLTPNFSNYHRGCQELTDGAGLPENSPFKVFPPFESPPGFAENFSAQRTRPVICITTNRVSIEPTVMARPVKPLKKKA